MGSKKREEPRGKVQDLPARGVSEKQGNQVLGGKDMESDLKSLDFSIQPDLPPPPPRPIRR